MSDMLLYQTTGEDLSVTIEAVRTLLHETGVRGILTTLLIIGVSKSIGRSYLLLANRVSPVRLSLSLIAGVLVFGFSLFVWTTIVFWMGRLYYDVDFTLTYWEINGLVILTFTPLTQAWLGLIPYLGNFFVRFQYVASACLLYLMMIVMGFSPGQAFIVMIAGAAILWLAQRTILYPLILLQNRLAGTHLRSRYRNVIRESRLEFG